MQNLIKIFILCLIYIQSLFADDICEEYDYLIDYKQYGCFRLEHSRYCVWDYYNPYNNLTVNTSDTTIDIISNGGKDIIVHTLLGDNCLETKTSGFDSVGKFIYSYSYVEKHRRLLQITYKDIAVKIIYGETPCDFTLVESPSEKETAFNFNGVNDDAEYGKFEEKFPDLFSLALDHGRECERYKEYIEYIEFMNSLEK